MAKTSTTRVNDYFTVEHGRGPARETHADRDVDRFQVWLNTHRLGGIKIQKQGHDLVQRIADTLVEQQFWSHARIRTTDDDGYGPLPLGERAEGLVTRNRRDELLAFLRPRHHAILLTVRRDGRRPRAHAHAREAAGRVRGHPVARDAGRVGAVAAGDQTICLTL